MNKQILFASVAAAMAFTAHHASAADIAPVPAGGHFYVGAFGGATWFGENGSDFSADEGYTPLDVWVAGPISGNLSLDSDTGFLIGGVAGYHWGNGLRSELELSYSQANLDGFDVDWDGTEIIRGKGDRDLDFDGDVSVTYIMGNLWYDFGDMLNMGGISPYLGGGLGVGFVNIDIDSISGVDLDASGDETGFAYQFGGGLLWEMTDSIEIDLGYRYRGVSLEDYDQSLTSHNVLLGLNFGF